MVVLPFLVPTEGCLNSGSSLNSFAFSIDNVMNLF